MGGRQARRGVAASGRERPLLQAAVGPCARFHGEVAAAIAARDGERAPGRRCARHLSDVQEVHILHQTFMLRPAEAS